MLSTHNIQVGALHYETRFFEQIRSYFTRCHYDINVECYDRDIVYFSLSNNKECYQCACVYPTNPTCETVIDAFHELSNKTPERKTALLFINQDEISDSLQPLRDFETVLISRNKLRQMQGLQNELGEHYQHIQLHAHNDTAYDDFNQNRSHRTAFVRATGTGKSFLIARISQDFLHHKVCIFAPNQFILSQQKAVLNTPNMHFFTYQSTIQDNKEFALPTGTKAVFVDEFHRLGAERWHDAVISAADKVGATVIGMSATHIRYLDNKRNMADEIFNGHVIAPLTLSDAIGRGILPEPVYISALYEISDSIKQIKRNIERTKILPHTKKQYLSTLKNIEIDWQRSDGIADIITYYLPALTGHYIVFCENIEHLKNIRCRMKRWMSEAVANIGREDIAINMYDIHSKQCRTKNDATLNAFERSQLGINLLFVVDILNEGKHVEDIDGLFFFRKTMSPTIYQQQVGRCLSTGASKAPVVFDMVSNIHNFDDIDLWRDIQQARRKHNENREKKGLDTIPLSTTIVHQLEHFKDRMRTLDEQVKASFFDIDRAITLFKDYLEEHDHLLIKRNDIYQEQPIGYYVKNIRALNRDNKLTDKQIKRLANIGFPYNYSQYVTEYHICAIEDYYQQYGHANIEQSVIHKHVRLGVWINRLRNDHVVRKKLTQDHINRLSAVGFVFDLEAHRNETLLANLRAFKKMYGHCNVPYTYVTEHGHKLGSQCHTQKQKFQKGTLSPTVQQDMEAMGFNFSIKDTCFETRFLLLQAYYKENGHLQVPYNYTVDGINLSTFLHNFRKRKANPEQSNINDQLHRLYSIGFTDTAIEGKQIKTLNEYIQHLSQNNTSTESFKKLKGRLRKIKQQMQAGTLPTSVYRFMKSHNLLNRGFFKTKAINTHEQYYDSLLAYYDEHEDLNLPRGYVMGTINLYNFVVRLRKSIKDGTPLLNQEQIKILTSKGLCLDPIQSKRDKNLQIVCDFITQNKGKNIPIQSAAYEALRSLKRAYEAGAVSKKYLTPLFDAGLLEK